MAPFSRGIFTLALAVWLPLCCCCRVRALADLAIAAVGESSVAPSCCCGGPVPSDDQERPRERCLCEAERGNYLTGGTAQLPEASDDLLVMPPTALAELVLDAGRTLVGVDSAAAGMKSRPTLLGLHCALVT